IPEFARMLGKGMNEFRKASEDIRKEFHESTSDLKEDFEEARQYITEQGREMKEDIKRAGEDVKQTLEDDSGRDDSYGDESTKNQDDTPDGSDEVSREVYGINADGKRDETGSASGEEDLTGDELDRDEEEKRGEK
ncbi:MAG: hypothetical protein PWQ06_1783, partial [Anaerophaga sp.]|nr:hypothetical protein [Anaerophaga sp.]